MERVSRARDEIERRLEAAQRAYTSSEIARLRREAQDAAASCISSTLELAGDHAVAEAEHRKWQAIHRYVRAAPYRDDATAPRPRQWQQAVALARDVGDLDLLEWASSRADLAYAESARSPARNTEHEARRPTYLILLKFVADRKRRSRAALRWAQTAAERGWITCDSTTLGANLIALHAASVHSRDNPDYTGPCDGAYEKR